MPKAEKRIHADRIHRFSISAVLTLIGLSLSGSLAAQTGTETKPPRKLSFVALPLVYYSPETRLAGGVGGLMAFRPAGARPENRPTSVFFSAIYTQNEQSTWQVKPEAYWKGEDWMAAGNFELSRFPNKFFGLGNDTPDSTEEKYTPRQIALEVQVQRRILPGKKVYAGLIWAFDRYRFQEFEAGGLLAGGGIPGHSGGVVTGAGLIAKSDSRDNLFFPGRGHYWQFSAVFYGPWAGGDYKFSKFKADLRSYVPVFAAPVLALQVQLEATAGAVPFMAMPKLGGDKMMRGFFGGRYRDKIFAGAQAEFRFPLGGKLSAGVFAGGGEVAGRWRGLSISGLRFSAGGGLRFRISKEGTNVRVDAGFGKGVSSIYFTANEAF